MSFLNKIFNNTNEAIKSSKINWISLTDSIQLSEIIEESKQKPILIFKHSTRCSVSRMVLKQFENEFDLHEKMDCYFLDLLEYRAISNEIATQFNVEHQSPQILVIKNGVCVYNASHESINANYLKQI